MLQEIQVGVLIAVLSGLALASIMLVLIPLKRKVLSLINAHKKPPLNKAIFKAANIWKKEFPKESKLLGGHRFFENHFYEDLVKLLRGKDYEVAILCEKLREGTGYAPGIDAEILVLRYIELFKAIAESSKLLFIKEHKELPLEKLAKLFPTTDNAVAIKKDYAIVFHVSDQELVRKLTRHLDSSATLRPCSGTLSKVKDWGFARARHLIIFPSDKLLTELRVDKDQWWNLIENSEECHQRKITIVLATVIRKHHNFSFPPNAIMIIQEVEAGDIRSALEKFITQLRD